MDIRELTRIIEEERAEAQMPDLFTLYFDGELAGQPYESPEEEARDRAYLVGMYLHCALLMRDQIDRANSGRTLPGLSVPIEEARAVVVDAFRFNRGQSLTPEQRAHIRRGWEHTDSRARASGGELSRMTDRFAPGRFERFCLYLSLAARLDRGTQRLLAHLQDDVECLDPTLNLAQKLFRLAEEVPLADCLTQAHTRAWALLYEDGAGSGLTKTFRMRENVFHQLLGVRTSGAQVSGICEAVRGEEISLPRDTGCGGEVCESVRRAVRRAGERGQGVVIQLWGPQGSGRRHVILACAAREKWDLLLIRGMELAQLSSEALHAFLRRVESDAVISGFFPVLENGGALDGERAGIVLEELMHAGVPAVFFCSEEPDSFTVPRGCTTLRYELGAMDVHQTVRFWEGQTADIPMEPSVDLRVLSSKYHLSPGQIAETVSAASLLARDGVVRESDLAGAIMNAGQGALSRQCVKIAPVFSFDDLIFPDATRRQVRAILDRVRDAYRVGVEWGFGQRYAYGRGIGILMYGRPGTGKTMCAQVLARELQLELYKVDLSQMVSKYIGETEKNLSDVFRSARRSNAILFFDEADSLFSKRTTDTGNSNDKYANMETAHLLQKMEEFDGITILATNLAGTFDKAFYRRLQYVINIPLPDEETRRVLWRRSFPERCPIDRSVDFDVLARQHEISPSTIKSTALSAAYRACAERADAVGMRHILLALRDELSKEGKNLSRQEMLGFDLE